MRLPGGGTWTLRDAVPFDVFAREVQRAASQKAEGTRDAVDEATKLLKEFKLLKGVTAEGVIAQTDAAAAFNLASKKGPREGGVAQRLLCTLALEARHPQNKRRLLLLRRAAGRLLVRFECPHFLLDSGLIFFGELCDCLLLMERAVLG